MKAYVINMEKSIERKKNMKVLLDQFDYLDYEFIHAIDGNILDENEKNNLFDRSHFIKRYLREPSNGDIGCSLSHRLCYKRLLDDDEPYAMIFEDDITIKYDIYPLLQRLFSIYNSNEPVVILFSGWYWFSKSKKLDRNVKIRKVVDGFLSQSYVINKAAAKKILKLNKGIVADDWRFYKKNGVKIYGIGPHAFDQVWQENCPSTIDHNNALSKNNVFPLIRVYGLEFKRKLLKLIGLFETCDYLEK